MAISSETFRGSEAPSAAKSQDLTISWTRENLTLGCALMKLAEGRGVSEKASLTTGVTAPTPLEGGSAPLTTGSPIGEQMAGRPSPPPPVMERMPRSHQGRSPLFGSGIPSLENHQSSLHLICIKQTGIWGRLSTLGEVLKNQKADRGEKEVLSAARLASSLLGPLHRLNCLSYELRDGPRPIVLAYIEHKVRAVRHSSVVGTSPQPDSRHRKRKSYFQYFSFDFFSIAVMKPSLLLKQYHPKSPEYSPGKRYYFSRADLLSLVMALGGSEKWLLGPSCGSKQVGAPGNSDPSATISVTGGMRPFRLGIEPPGLDDDSVEELVEAPSEDELLEECPEAELGEPDRKEVLELEEATSASVFD
ncbi:hypothetical protein Cgig2_014505 [Carnegiea gigantea]|uniref:Uncharacterized protein n=1 Tax=Carnegiea gigantea TaxID=171969 RepID=A0A9Q1JYW5_9CARY|nr:hypothetical protein Cgig2_014505 [Carnegiea gigantea]